MTTIFRRPIHTNGAAAAGRARLDNGRKPHDDGALDVRTVKLDIPDEPTIWGLTVRELHDAYWRARGVQCLRPGANAPTSHSLPDGPDRKADLFLLLAPRQLVLFDLSHIVNRLVWHGAALTYVHVLDLFAPSYREQAIVDDCGFVQRIARHYTTGVAPRTRHRLLLTDRPRIALRWVAAHNVREARRAVRRPARGSLAAPSIDHVHTTGCCFDEAAARERVLHELIERWSDPDRAIDGIEEIAPRVWALSESPAFDRPPVLVGPAWLGRRWNVMPKENAPRAGHSSATPCIIGPEWRFDPPSANGRSSPAARIRDFDEIDHRHPIRGVPAPPKRPIYSVSKRIFDFAGCLAALAVLGPLQLLIALAILLDDGRPVLFRHRRQSRGGRPFDCLKFRTMRRNAEAMVPHLKANNLCDGPQVFIKDDPRVTRVGRILRRLHLDELPQLWNVLHGDMSIVGPRPSPDNENQFCPAWRELRLSVRPGITGLWQLKRTRSPGRDFQEWIRYDIEYVRQASFRLDLSIMARTAVVLLIGRNRQCD